MLWLRNKDIGEELGLENIFELIDKEVKRRFETRNPANEQIRDYKRHGPELIDGEKFVYTLEDIIMPIIMYCRLKTSKAIEFKTRLGFNQYDVIMKRKQSVLTIIMKVFTSEKILIQYSVLSYKIDLSFSRHMQAIEI